MTVVTETYLMKVVPETYLMVGEAPCVALVEVAAEQLLEAIYIVPVVPVALALQRAGAALAVGNMIVI